MVLRSINTVFTAALSLVIVGCSWADEPSTGKFPAKPVSAQVEQPEEAPASTATEDAEEDLFGPVDKQDPLVNDAPGTVEEEVAEAAAEEAAVEGPAMTAATDDPNAQKVHELTERIVALETELEELRTNLASMQQALARVQDPAELSRRALGAMVEDTDLRGTMGELLQGKVRLVNNSGAPVVMFINGTAWTVVEGESFVLAPVGTVSFLYDPAGKPVFKGIQEWVENRENGQFELEYKVESATPATTPESTSERSVLSQ
ncbi:hypothetical protein [Aeoliella sp. SH292]|uniref:hypothetical protein n=1 Tax=Aeoliella sp. SH292 TaxID=3454464 RepID=UPI003F97E853